jgi:uracil-DNA glycosylase
MNVQIEESWKARLEPEFEKDYFRTLTNFVREEYSQYPIYPPGRSDKYQRIRLFHHIVDV